MTKIPWWRTSFGEDEARSLAASISAEHISQGPVTAEFERRIGEALDVPYAVVTTSGSVALLMALMALGIAAWRDQLDNTDDTTVVFRDSAFADDVAKTNCTEILRQRGIRNVRSI